MDFAFRSCESLQQITLPNTLTKIDSQAFRESGLKSITVPNSVKTIGSFAFYECQDLQQAKIGDGVTEIGECVEMTTLTLGNRLETIRNYAFSGCKKLASVTIPNSVSTLETEAFSFCNQMNSVVIGNGVTEIGEHAFHECVNLTNLVIGNSVTTIGNFAFHACSSLTSVNIPNSVQTIGNCAFNQCQGITKLSIGSGATSIGYGAFSGAWKLASVTCNAETPPSFAADNGWSYFNYNVYEQATLYVPGASVSRYKNAEIWKDFTNIKAIPDHVPGDVNGDGEVNIADVNAVISAILGNAIAPACDVNGDGEVNIADVNAVISIILKQ